MDTILYSLLAGGSTVIGAIILVIFGSPGKKLMASFLGFAAGIMLAISLFELMPEGAELSNTLTSVIAFLLGCAMMWGVDKVLPHAHLSTDDNLVLENNENLKLEKTLRRTGYLIFFGIALHNIPEGLAIGAGLEASPELGLSLAIAIGLHNIPEGLAVAGPLKAGGLSSFKAVIFTLVAGLTTVIGAAIGLLIFNISPPLIGGSLAFAAGAMVYIVCDELIPQSNIMHAHIANLSIIIGLVVGFMLFF